ncbi:MAG TPA: elongation factor P maturation arginine rhamnosyltransferase EarP [Methylibium sp.]|uniref:elongation factor P maturation arginine rhamnosyltransferase EarP n=1 Tax=Methylibium sp. TaxID=2067992 RepID=UPI002DB996D0|nr:elongation factor P maturation arginine rhamnosyltransferase EarP [Methylibium sp.]HEU4460195.1 elongation factor P maturation arginine rhamnosyltransferase EarP [Methylibium sp.]
MDAPRALPRLRWDLFCRVVDNHGDLGVAWRLARRLDALGQRVRLWIDDARALRWMAGEGEPRRIDVRPWAAPPAELADVIVETFGADLPDGWLQRMATATKRPVWIDVEYLSAERYVERSHGLPSPQSQGPGAGLTRWFFYPGFTPRTGGLLLGRADAQAGHAALGRLGLGPFDGFEVSLFGYAQPQLEAAIAAWRRSPTRVLACPGPAADQLAARLGVGPTPGSHARLDRLVVHWLPWLPQPDYDALLAACDLNLVRGEDSFVQALACGRPFIWQLYRQDDGAQAAKLEAFLQLYLADVSGPLPASLRACFRAWNGEAAEFAPPEASGTSPWRQHAAAFARSLHDAQAQRGDLGLQLLRFALSRH